MLLSKKTNKKELTQVAINNKPRDQYMLLVTARAPPIGSDVEQIKAVTKTATSAGETNKADDSFKKRAEKFFSRERS